jgi:hypothetical protein
VIIAVGCWQVVCDMCAAGVGLSLLGAGRRCVICVQRVWDDRCWVLADGVLHSAEMHVQFVRLCCDVVSMSNCV